MKRKLINNSGVTLIEILIGIVISVLMMGAMYTAYNAVNNSYSKVTDRAKISAQGRDLVTMIVRDIRNAGFRYFGDNIQINLLEHSPILIKKDIVFGGGHFDSKQNFIYKKYKSSYHCERSKIEDRAKGKNNSGAYDTVDGFAIFKTVKVWENGKWANPNTDNDDYTFEKQKVADYIDQFLFDNNDHLITRHILGLYNSMYCSREWRNNILDKSFFKLKGDKLRFATDKIEKMISLRQAA